MMNPNGNSELAYKRIVLKLSGEALAGPQGYGIDPSSAEVIANKVKQIHDLGIQIAVVIGAGNLWRGSIGVHRGMEQSTADQMGMIGTVMNGLALQDALQRLGVTTRVQTAVQMNQVAEPYIRLRAIRHMEKGRIVVVCGGTGNPFFTTDTPAAVRAAELLAGAVLKGTHSGVDGVYTADPKLDANATKLDEVSYMDVLNRGLNVMDPTSITFCMDNKLPIVVFDVLAEGNLRRVLVGEDGIGTLVR